MMQTADVVEGVLAILEEGASTGTNKFGLLLALIDLAPSMSTGDFIRTPRIAEKLIEIHWQHAREYADTALSQVSSGNRELKALSVVRQLQECEGVDAHTPIEQAKARILSGSGGQRVWERAVKELDRDLCRNPVKRLQKVAGVVPPFLYQIDEEPGGTVTVNLRLRLLKGVREALVRHGTLLRGLVEYRFAREVVVANRGRLGPFIEDQLLEHLFGVDRSMPPARLREDLWRIQDKRCLYTGAILPSPRDDGHEATATAHLDHMVPWSRNRLSAIENLVLVAQAPNLRKGNLLLGPTMLEKWMRFIESKGAALEQAAEEYSWPSDLERVVQIAASLYASHPATVWDGMDSGIVALGVHEADRSTTRLRAMR